MKSRVIAGLLITMGFLICFSGQAVAQTPAIQVHLDIEPVASPSSQITPLLTPELLEPTSTPTTILSVPPKQGAGTDSEGINTFFWALAVILGASILWLIGELLGPSTSLRASPTKKDKESENL